MKEVILILDSSKRKMMVDVDEFVRQFNSFVSKNRDEKINISLYTYNQDVQCLMDHVSIEEIRPLRKIESYDGVADFYNSLGSIMERVSDRINGLKGKKAPDTVSIYIVSSYYNESCDNYTKEDINTFITYQKEDYGWNFFFFGLNTKNDVSELGIDNIFTVDCTNEGVEKIFNTILSGLQK